MVDTISLNVRDAFGNSGVLDATIKIPSDEFKEKYKDILDDATSSITFEDAVDSTSDFFLSAADDIGSFKKIRNSKRTERNSENQFLSYKVAGFTPVVGDESDKSLVTKMSGDKFRVVALYNGKLYNVVYNYTGDEDINDFIQNINDESEDYDFTRKSDVISFWQLMDDYGDIVRSYPLGISTSGRNYSKVKINLDNKNESEMLESEGVQTTDIAPKVDQNVGGLVKVKLKKKKKVEESDIFSYSIKDLLIESVSQEDEFYGSRGFIKDENGRYHFGDYYITESGKVVHKSKLNEFNVWPEEKEVIDDFNNRLKTLETFSDLQKFLDDLSKNEWGLVLMSKRAKWHAYAFTDAGDNKTNYLLSDGESSRNQKIKDLYKWLEIGNNPR